MAKTARFTAFLVKKLVSQFALALAAYAALAAAFLCIELAIRRAESVNPPGLEPAKPLVVIDAGHGGSDGGAVANQLIEKNLALDLARRLKRQFEAAGIAVLMTRDGDDFLPLEKRAQIANDNRAAAFVSLHLNTTTEGESDARGLETYFSTRKSLAAAKLIRERAGVTESKAVQDERGRLLAEAIQRAACKQTGAADRGAKERSYTVIHTAACPAVLVECGFITNDAEAAKLKQPAYRDRLVSGVAEAVSAFLRVQEVDPARGLVLKAPGAAGDDKRVELVAEK